MDNLILSELTRSRADSLLKSLPHGVVVSGAQGSGRLTLAKALAQEMGVQPSDIQVISNTTEASLGIEDSRDIQRIYKLKALSKSSKRAIIIEDAERMTVEAQNALLKILEEPPIGSLFLFTVTSLNKLLPTIRSRAASIHVHRPSKQHLKKELSNRVDAPAEFEKKYSMAHGEVGSLIRLIEDTNYFEERSMQLSEAKQIVQSDGFDRLKFLTSSPLKKAEAIRVLQDVQLILQLSTQRATSSASGLRRLVENSSLVLDCIDAIEKNGQVKLHLDRLCVGLR